MLDDTFGPSPEARAQAAAQQQGGSAGRWAFGDFGRLGGLRPKSATALDAGKKIVGEAID